MSLSDSTTAVLAIAAAAAAAGALLLALGAWLKLRNVRRSQQVMLGGGKDDLVDFAVSLQARIDDLHRAVDEIAAALARVDRRIDESIAKTSIVRYDAYEGTGGHQSASLAFLDAARSGIVVSAIQGRDYARIYMKELDHVVPRSRGGESVWENVVTSCAPCNLRKGNRLLEEAAMVLRKAPKPPAPALFIRLAAPRVPRAWQPYLEAFAAAA